MSNLTLVTRYTIDEISRDHKKAVCVYRALLHNKNNSLKCIELRMLLNCINLVNVQLNPEIA